jgi:hypothetical protein
MILLRIKPPSTGTMALLHAGTTSMPAAITVGIDGYETPQSALRQGWAWTNPGEPLPPGLAPEPWAPPGGWKTWAIVATAGAIGVFLIALTTSRAPLVLQLPSVK